MSCLHAIFLSLLFIWPHLAYTAANEVDDIVVTASRGSSKRFNAPRTLDTTSMTHIHEKQANAIPEALAETPGIHMQQTNRGSGSAIIRGLLGPQNLILVDGLRFNTATFRTGPNQYLATFDPFILKRIEVVRGPSSVLYGNGAMGGVVHLRTQSPLRPDDDRHWQTTMSTSGAYADQSFGGNIRLDGKSENAAAYIGGGYRFFGELQSGGNNIQPLSSYQSASFHSKVVWKPQPELRITGAYFVKSLRDAGRTDQLGKGDVRLYDNDDHFAYVRAKWFPSDTTASLIWHRLTDHINRYTCKTTDQGKTANKDECLTFVKTDKLSGPISRKRIYDDTTDVLGATLHTRTTLAQMAIQGGLDYFVDRVESSLTSAKESDQFVYKKSDRGHFSDNSSYQTAGLYAFATAPLWQIQEDTLLRTTFGGRWSHFAASADNVPGLGHVNYSHQGGIGSIGLQCLHNNQFNIYTTFIQGFRAPNLQETTTIGDTGSKFEIANDALKPEHSDTLEIGLKTLHDHISFDLVAYQSTLKNVIDEVDASYNGQTEVDSKPVVQRVNAKTGSISGLEGQIKFSLGAVTINNHATWTVGEVSRSDGSMQPARRIPPLFGSNSVRYQHTHFYLRFFINWAGAQTKLHSSDKKDLRICQTLPFSNTLNDPCTGTPAWYTLNINGGTTLYDGLKLEIALNNLTDRYYRKHGSGFDAPGVDLRIGLRATW